MGDTEKRGLLRLMRMAHPEGVRSSMSQARLGDRLGSLFAVIDRLAPASASFTSTSLAIRLGSRSAPRKRRRGNMKG